MNNKYDKYNISDISDDKGDRFKEDNSILIDRSHGDSNAEYNM